MVGRLIVLIMKYKMTFSSNRASCDISKLNLGVNSIFWNENVQVLDPTWHPTVTVYGSFVFVNF